MQHGNGKRDTFPTQNGNQKRRRYENFSLNHWADIISVSDTIRFRNAGMRYRKSFCVTYTKTMKN